MEKNKSRIWFILVMFLLIGLVLNLPLTEAYETSPISILTSLGGDISPSSGYYEIEVGKVVNLRANAGEGYTFWFWEIAVGNGSHFIVDNHIYYDNPHNLTIEKGLTYMVQAIYIPTNANITSLNPSPSQTSTITPNPSPTVPEFPFQLILILCAVIPLISIIVLRRRS